MKRYLLQFISLSIFSLLVLWFGLTANGNPVFAENSDGDSFENSVEPKSVAAVTVKIIRK